MLKLSSPSRMLATRVHQSVVMFVIVGTIYRCEHFGTRSIRCRFILLFLLVDNGSSDFFRLLIFHGLLSARSLLLEAYNGNSISDRWVLGYDLHAHYLLLLMMSICFDLNSLLHFFFDLVSVGEVCCRPRWCLGRRVLFVHFWDLLRSLWSCRSLLHSWLDIDSCASLHFLHISEFASFILFLLFIFFIISLLLVLILG